MGERKLDVASSSLNAETNYYLVRIGVHQSGGRLFSFCTEPDPDC